MCTCCIKKWLKWTSRDRPIPLIWLPPTFFLRRFSTFSGDGSVGSCKMVMLLAQLEEWPTTFNKILQIFDDYISGQKGAERWYDMNFEERYVWLFGLPLLTKLLTKLQVLARHMDKFKSDRHLLCNLDPIRANQTRRKLTHQLGDLRVSKYWSSVMLFTCCWSISTFLAKADEKVREPLQQWDVNILGRQIKKK